MKATKTCRVVKAEYLFDFIILVGFDDDTVREVDFSAPFSRLQGYYAQYRNPEKFKAFKIENDTLAWGDGWGVIFPAQKLYENNFSPTP